MLRKMLFAVMLCLASVLALAADPMPPTPEEIDAARQQGRYLATITLEKGKVEMVLEGRDMPCTVANFVKLAQAKYYDGQDFFIVEGVTRGDTTVGFISGGDPSGAGPGYSIGLELSPFLLAHQRGAVSMYRRQNSTECSGSQFVISRSGMPIFDGLFPIFAWVKSGMDIVDGVKKGDVMQSVTVAPYDGDEPCPLVTPTAEVAATRPPSQADVDAAREQGRYLATIIMENGKKITLVLEGKAMPVTVANFVKLAQAKYYDGLTFHRVEDDDQLKLIQGGCPQGTGGGGPGYAIRLEKSDLIHKAGALGMARSQDVNSAGSQFYIIRNDIPGLDGRYAVFGWVKDGLDVVGQIKVGDKIKSVTIAPYKGKEKCPMVK